MAFDLFHPLVYLLSLLILLCLSIVTFFRILKLCGIWVQKYKTRYWNWNRNIKKDISTCMVTNEGECDRGVSRLFADIIRGKNVLGFDCEWINQPKSLVSQPISLLQLCSSSGFCCLFRLNKLGHIPNSLKILLESEVVKLGVNCDKDAKLIQQNYNIQVHNFLDLRHLFSVDASLAKLSQTVIGVTISKELTVVCSNWNQEVLSNKQIEYAIKDAWVAVEIFKAWSVCKNEEFIESHIQKYLNIPFKPKKNQKEESQMLHRDNSNPPPLKLKFARKTPLYDNCWMYAPDGQVLCSCDKRKAHWYIQRGLAEVTCHNPFSIRLLFEPNSRPGVNAEGGFYRQFKKNCCVVCGLEGPFMKHYVMPREYRKHFPKNMKSHQSHDIVLTCLHCHAKSKIYTRQLKEDLAQVCDAPIHIPELSNYKQYKKSKNICGTLLNSGNNIPLERRKCLEESVKEFFGMMDINSEVLQKILSQKMTDNKSFVSHGEKVVEYFKRRQGGLIDLEVLWRKSFLQSMKPQFLPTAWSVHHNHKKLM